jgi:hypothetical protein
VKFFHAVVRLCFAAACISNTPAVWSQTSQQKQMKTCTAAADDKNLKGAVRESFIDDCLRTKEAALVLSPQQNFRSCRLKAGGEKLSGDALKKFMSNCLDAQNPSTR